MRDAVTAVPSPEDTVEPEVAAPWIDCEHRCEHRAAAADRKLYADEIYRQLRLEKAVSDRLANQLTEAEAALDHIRAAVLVIHTPVPTWTDSTYDEAGRKIEQNALYDDAGKLVYAPNYRMHCQNCRVDTPWPCPTAAAVGVTA